MSGPVRQDVVSAVRDVLAGHVGIEEAISGARLQCLVREMLDDRRIALRRIGEAVQEIRKTRPVCGLSALGYWLPADADELEQSVREKRRRALAILADLRTDKRHLAHLRGQQTMREVA